MTEDIEYGSVSGLFDREIKGSIDAPWRFQRQLERCNVLMAGEDQLPFEASVRALLGDLPIHVKNEVMARKDDTFEEDGETLLDKGFNSMTPDTWEYQDNCGVLVGTPENPFVFVSGHPEWDFYFDIPETWREAHEDEISRQSPKLVEGHLRTDHERLFEIIKECADANGLGWKYTMTAKEDGELVEVLPKGIAKKFEEVLADMIIQDRKDGVIYGWADMVDAMRTMNPVLPVLPPDEEVQPDE